MLPPLCFDLSALLRSLVLLAGLGKTPLARNYMLLYLHRCSAWSCLCRGFSSCFFWWPFMCSVRRLYKSGGEWSRNLAQTTNGSRSLRFCVCRSHICFSIKSLHFFVSGSDFRKPVSTSRRVSDLPFAAPYRVFLFLRGILHWSVIIYMSCIW